MTSPSSTCPECGKPLTGEHPVCPACLMRQALASRTVDNTGNEAPVSPPLSPEEIADKLPGFEILECLGRGGMGVVYKARQKSLDRIVAIKILPPERVGEERFSERFAVEAATLAKLSHPNIVTVHDFGETGGLFYIVMEYVDGVNLRDLLREGKLESKQALAIVPPVCEALQYAHDKGIVHRDIKPENLLLDRDGRIKIADFGIASLVGASGEVAGTPPYMAPEQKGNHIDHRADIYALGVVLYEMLTGERPDRNAVAPSNRVEIDVRLDEIVLRALAKKPELRYQTAGEFKTVVQTIAAAPPVEPAPAEESTRRKKRRKKVIFRFLDPLPDKNELLHMALTMLLAGLAIIAFMDGTWEKAREWIDQTYDSERSSEGHILRSVLFITCAVVAVILVWKLIHWLTGRRGEGENTGGIASAWIWLGLAALVLAFSNPWGARSWQCLIAAAALLSAWGVLRGRRRSPQNSIEPRPAAPPAHLANHPANMPRRRWRVIVLGTIILGGLAWFLSGSGRHYPISSMSSAYTAPVIGRIEFKCSHGEGFGGTGVSFDVKAWGDTQWKPSSGHHIGLEGERRILFKTRVDACRFTPPMAMVTASLNGKDWETRRIQLRAESCVQTMDFSNGLQVTIRWSPVEVPDLNHKSPDPIQQDVSRRGSEWADQQHPLMDISGPQAFGHVTERVVHEMESGLGDELLRLESGELFSLPKSKTDKWLAESFANLLVGKTGNDFQLILHKGIFRDMNDAEWDHATPETFRRAMEKGPGMMKPGKSENRWAAYDWTGGEVPATFGFHLASRAEGMLQVLGDTPDGTGLRIRYKLLPGPNGETILPPDFELVRDRATEIAGRYYPDLKFSEDGDRFIMQRNLRQFDVHNSSKTGDVSAETHKETGPAADGFILVLEPIVEAPVSQAFQADGPQILDRPYWKGFVDHRFDPEKRTGVAMFFDFGPSVNADFKDEMLRLLEEKPDAGSAEEKARQSIENIKAINDTNRFLDLELAVIDAKASGMGDNHPTVILAADVLARFKKAHPETPESVLRQLVGQRLDKAKEDLAALNKNGLGEVHPAVVMQKARIRALTEMLGEPEKQSDPQPVR